MPKSQYVRASFETCATPQFRVLSQDQCESIFLGALEVLQHTGAEVNSPEALEIYRKGGCRVDGTRVRFPSHLVEWAVRTAPSRITMYDRNGNRSMYLEGQNVYYGPGSANTFTLDPFTGERRRPLKQDTARAAIVSDALSNMDYVEDNGAPMDVTPTLADVHAFQAMVTNTTKPIIHWGFGINQYQDIVDMASACVGGLSELQKRPFLILYSESSPPLRHSSEAIDKALFAAKKDLPCIYTPCIFSGGVAPATMAGSLVVAVADALIGIVAGQLVREGSSFIMGGPISTMDMSSSSLAYGAPELSLLSAGLSNVARYMGIPMFSTAGCSDSKVIDTQLAIEAAFSILVAGLSGANLIHDCNLMDKGVTGSLELTVLDDEIIGMVKRILRGIEVNDDTLAVDVIDHVSPGGHFLGEEHTIERFRDEFWWPTLISRVRYDEWKLYGSKTLGQRVKEKTQEIINEHRAEPLSQKILDQIQAVVDRAEAREASLKSKK